MSDVVVEEFLEHFGTKGMKWGVRNSRPAGGSNGSLRNQSTPKKKIAVGVAVWCWCCSCWCNFSQEPQSESPLIFREQQNLKHRMTSLNVIWKLR